MAADLVRPPKHMLKAQLCGRNERKHNHEMDFKLENREQKKKESFEQSYSQWDGPPLGGYRHPE